MHPAAITIAMAQQLMVGGGRHVDPDIGFVYHGTGARYGARRPGCTRDGTRGRNRHGFVLEGALGFAFALGRAVSLEPVVRYIHVVQSGDNIVLFDAAFWTAGLSLSVQVPCPSGDDET